MKVIQQIQELQAYTNKAIQNVDSLHKRERQNKLIFLTQWYTEIFLDLVQERGKQIDYNNDPLFLQLSKIRDQFIYFRR